MCVLTHMLHVWNIYLHLAQTYGFHAGRYSNPMEHLGYWAAYPQEAYSPQANALWKKQPNRRCIFVIPFRTDLGCGKEEWKRHSFSHTEVTFQNSSYQGDPLQSQLQSQHDQDFFLIYLNQLMVFNWWFGLVVWIPLWKGLLLKSILESQTTN